MVRVASQETFEAAVVEMMKDFEMDQEEAIQDVIEQFQAQGVDLSNIIKDLILSDSSKQHTIVKCVGNLKNITKEDTPSFPNLVLELDELKKECDVDIAHKLMASKEGAYVTVFDCISKYEDEAVLLAALKCMVSLQDGQPDLLRIEDVAVFNSLLDKQKNDEILVQTLKWISTCCLKHENNRQNIFKTNVLVHLKRTIETHRNAEILSEVCTVIRHLVLDDDIRVEFGQAHEHARLIATETLHLFTQMLKEFKSHQSFVGDILLTIATLVVRHEFCQKVDEAGGLQFILEVMVEFPDNEKINRQCFKLLKALAGNDDVKRNIIRKGGASLICAALDTHKAAVFSASSGIGCVSALALRDVENSKSLFETGLPEIILECMKIHNKNLSVVKNASWAVRNMSIRCPEHQSKFRDLNAEEIFNDALKTFEKEAGHDIKSALRDLGCNVKLNEQWTGKGGQIHSAVDYQENFNIV